MSWSYSGNPADSDKDAVRFEIQDTTSSSPLLQDEEIEWAILQETTVAAAAPATIVPPNLYRAAARCMEALDRLFAAQADEQIGTLKLTYSKQSQQYAVRAQELRARAAGMEPPYAGGQSIQEKLDRQADTDAVKPAFTRREFDNPWVGDQSGYHNEDLGPQRP